ncbi:MAG: hypothetical protein ACLTQI_00100 [Slackia sp.]
MKPYAAETRFLTTATAETTRSLQACASGLLSNLAAAAAETARFAPASLAGFGKRFRQAATKRRSPSTPPFDHALYATIRKEALQWKRHAGYARVRISSVISAMKS